MTTGSMNKKGHNPAANAANHQGSKELRDLTDDRYGPLRRPKTITFYKNGDRNFQGKTIQITPHRYLNFEELMTDLSKKLNLPYGVRKIYSLDGKIVEDIEKLQSDQAYVCAGFEKWKKVEYEKLEQRSRNRMHKTNHSLPSHSNTSGGVSPYRNSNPAMVFNARHGHPDFSQFNKNRSLLFILANTTPPVMKNMIVSKQNVTQLGPFIQEISNHLGRPKWKNDRISRIYTIKGEQVKDIATFFSEPDVFIGVGHGETLRSAEKHRIMESLYPDSKYRRRVIKEYEDARASPPKKTVKKLPGLSDQRKRQAGVKASKSDSAVKVKVSPYSSTHHLDDPYSSSSDKLTNYRRPPRAADGKVYPTFTKPTRNGRTLTMMEQEEKYLKQELKDKEDLIRDQQTKQEELLARLREQEEVSARMKHDLKGQRETARASRHQQQRVAEEQRMREIQLEYERKEREMQEKMDRFKREFEESQLKIRQKQEISIQSERERLEKEKRKIEQERAEIVEMELEQRRKEIEQKLNQEWAKIEAEKQSLEEQKRHINESATVGSTSRNSIPSTTAPTPTGKKKNSKSRTPVAVFSDSESDEGLNEVVGPGKREDDVDQWRKRLRAEPKPRTIRQKSDIETRYEIMKKIGDGNFAIVHKCRMANTSSEFAMKIIDKGIMKGKEDMIENEIAIMRLCRHPNIIRLVEEFETLENIYLVLELVRGGDLFDAITESVRYDESVASSLIQDLASPIAYLHARNIVHRDVKPENCLLERHPNGKLQIKLADFGLAMEVTKPIFQVCGTPTYVAPEILVEGGGNGYGLEVDNWAVGVIAYILLCGFPPFRSPNRDQNQLFDIIVRGEYEFISPYWDDISQGAMDLIRQLLVINPKKRLTADGVLNHAWIRSGGQFKGPNLQRQVTMELARANLRSQQKIQQNV